MTRLVGMLLLLILQIFTIGCAAEPLAPFRWDYRILMVFAPADQLGSIKVQLDELEEEVIDRHMLWFLVDDEALITNYDGPLSAGFAGQIAQCYSNGDAKKVEVEVVLIGKDGGVKYRADKLTPETIFATIDRMPMRRAEMNR